VRELGKYAFRRSGSLSAINHSPRTSFVMKVKRGELAPPPFGNALYTYVMINEFERSKTCS
jgi:hypothetical protein